MVKIYELTIFVIQKDILCHQFIKASFSVFSHEKPQKYTMQRK